MGLIFYLLAFWGLSALYHRFLMPRDQRARRMLKQVRSHARDRQQWDRDILTEQQAQKFKDLEAYAEATLEELKTLPALRKQAAAAPDDKDVAQRLQALEQRTDPAGELQSLTKTLNPPTVEQAVEGAAIATAKKMAKGKAAADKDDPGAATMQKLKKKGAASKDDPWDFVGQAKGMVEMLLVVFGVVMGLRGLFLQPFKIPTGSMQPTLYGVHFEGVDESLDPNPVQRAWQWVNFGKRWTDVSVESGGQVGIVSRGGGFPAAKMLFPDMVVQVGAQRVTLPGNAREVEKYLAAEHTPYPHRLTGPMVLEPSDVLARGWLVQGDHLFVDRVSYNFREPKRGDIVVFNTIDITYDGDPLDGLFFIKRLVGLPGETIEIRDRRLWVKEAGASEFRMLTAEDHPAFERMYSLQGDYRGYVPLRRQGQFSSEYQDAWSIGPDQYMMMGDNSENSLDSRYWGMVPRQNIIGRACMVWWPFSRRFGRVDIEEPLDYPSEIDYLRYGGPVPSTDSDVDE